MRTLARRAFRRLLRLYSREHGKHSILTRFYFPLLAPRAERWERTRLYNGLVMEVNPAEYLQAFLYNFGGYEFPSLRFIERLLRPGQTVLDVGAQVGFMSLVCAARVGPSGTVYAFEPEPRNFRQLRRNIELNHLSQVHAEQLAASSTPCSLRLFLGKGENTGVHSTHYNARTMSTTSVDVPGLPLDAYVHDHGIRRVDLIKMDIEGAELDALRGLHETMRRFQPVLLVEISAELQNLSGTSVRQFKEQVCTTFGSLAYRIQDDGTLVLSPVAEFHLNDNVVFVPESRTSELRAMIRIS